MKKLLFSLVFVLFIHLVNIAQSKEYKSKISSENELTQAEHDSLKAIKIYNDSVNYQISLINSHLNSIKIKWDWILEHPEDKAIADEQNWFVRMTEIKAELESKKQKLVESLK